MGLRALEQSPEVSGLGIDSKEVDAVREPHTGWPGICPNSSPLYPDFHVRVCSEFCITEGQLRRQPGLVVF